jgi:hypothetical protein
LAWAPFTRFSRIREVGVWDGFPNSNRRIELAIGTDEKVEIANKLQILKSKLDPFLVNLILDPTSGLELIHRDENTIDILPKKRVRVVLK